MTVIKFKSFQVHFSKEKSGAKPNTLRKIDLKDERFKELIQYSKLINSGLLQPLFIEIVNSEKPKLKFVRKISDVTIFEDWIIISWRP